MKYGLWQLTCIIIIAWEQYKGFIQTQIWGGIQWSSNSYFLLHILSFNSLVVVTGRLPNYSVFLHVWTICPCTIYPNQSVFNVQSAQLIMQPMLFMKHQLNLKSATHGRRPNQNKSMVYLTFISQDKLLLLSLSR